MLLVFLKEFASNSYIIGCFVVVVSYMFVRNKILQYALQNLVFHTANFQFSTNVCSIAKEYILFDVNVCRDIYTTIHCYTWYLLWYTIYIIMKRMKFIE